MSKILIIIITLWFSKTICKLFLTSDFQKSWIKSLFSQDRKQNIVLFVFSCLSFMGRLYFQTLFYNWRVYTFWKKESRGIGKICTIRKAPNNINMKVESWKLDTLLHKSFILIDSKAHLKWIKLLITNVQVRGEKKQQTTTFF